MQRSSKNSSLSQVERVASRMSVNKQHMQRVRRAFRACKSVRETSSFRAGGATNGQLGKVRDAGSRAVVNPSTPNTQISILVRPRLGVLEPLIIDEDPGRRGLRGQEQLGVCTVLTKHDDYEFVFLSCIIGILPSPAFSSSTLSSSY